jgi:alpha-L-fucosidase
LSIKIIVMKGKIIVLFFLISFCTQPSFSQERYQANWESLKKYQIPDWFRDAKFGIFIHWGVYSVPAFREWYPHWMYEKGTETFTKHIEKYGPQNKFGYKDFIPMFKAEKFNADEWVDLFKASGAKYVVPVAEHHDGFAMYATALSKWNAAEMGPKRDIIGELAASVKKKGLILGLSSHRIEHWWFFHGGKTFDSDVMDPKYNDFYGPAREESETPSPEFMNDWLLRSTELVEKYKPQLVWFDWWIEHPAMEPYRKSFTSYFYNKGLEWKKGVVLNYKNIDQISFPDDVAVLDMERGKLADIRKQAWQTDDAIGNKSWGYSTDNVYKTPQYVITNLIDIVSKNGNLLLNLGPRSDGTITDEDRNVLLQTGKWLSVNGEAIYGTRPWKLSSEGPTKSASGYMNYQKDPFNAKDIRFTTKGDTLFAILLGVPKEKIIITNLSLGVKNGTVASVELLGSNEKVSWLQKANGLQIVPAKSYASDYAVTYKISFKK